MLGESGIRMNRHDEVSDESIAAGIQHHCMKLGIV